MTFGGRRSTCTVVPAKVSAAGGNGTSAGGSIAIRWVIAAGTTVAASGMSSHTTATDDGGSWTFGVSADAASDVAARSESPVSRVSVAPESESCTSTEWSVTSAGMTLVSSSS